MAVMNDEKDKQERVFIDPLATNLEAGEALELDPNADAYERLAPPPMGRYDLHVTEAKECWELGKTDAGDTFYKANLECRIVNSVDPELNGQMVFARVSSFIGRGKKISTMAYVLLKMGYPKEKLAGSVSHKDLMVKFAKWIRKEDRVIPGCLLDWQGYSAAQKAVIFNKMSDFPKDKEGNYQHIVEYRKAGHPSEEIIARAKLKDWGGTSGATGAATGAGKGTAAPKVVKRTAATEPDEDDTPVAAPAPAAKAGKKPPTGPSKEELAALLDGDDD